MKFNFKSFGSFMSLLFLLSSCKNEPSNISGAYESLPSDTRHFAIEITQAGDGATIGDLKEKDGDSLKSVGALASSVSAFGQREYSVSISRGKCEGIFDAEFSTQISDVNHLVLKLSANSKCPNETYFLTQKTSVNSTKKVDH